MGLFLHLPLDAFAPPRGLEADLLGLENEALGLHHVEEQLAHQVGGPVAGHLQTRPKPSVARAVHDGVDPPVEETVLLLQGADEVPAAHVVVPAAPVGAREGAELVVRGGGEALAAPLGARHSHRVQQVALPPLQLVLGGLLPPLVAVEEPPDLVVVLLARLAQPRVVEPRRQVVGEGLVVAEDAHRHVPGARVAAAAVPHGLHVVAEGVEEGVHGGRVRHVLAVPELVLARVDELHEVAAVRHLAKVQLRLVLGADGRLLGGNPIDVYPPLALAVHQGVGRDEVPHGAEVGEQARVLVAARAAHLQRLQQAHHRDEQEGRQGREAEAAGGHHTPPAKSSLSLTLLHSHFTRTHTLFPSLTH